MLTRSAAVVGGRAALYPATYAEESPSYFEYLTHALPEAKWDQTLIDEVKWPRPGCSPLFLVNLHPGQHLNSPGKTFEALHSIFIFAGLLIRSECAGESGDPRGCPDRSF